jgi:hypothetical protein
MSSSSSQLVLWCLQPILQAAIAVLMFRRGQHKTFPVFFAYMPVQIVIFCVGFAAYRFTGVYAYFIVFCVLTAIDLIFNFKILHEIFLDIFRPYDALKDLGSALFKWGALVMILVSVVLISATPGTDSPLLRTLLVVQRSLRLVQCGLLVFLLAFCRYLGVSWKRPSFGLALGFGTLAGSEMIINALYTGSHFRLNVANVANTAAVDVAVILWLLYFALNQREAVTPVLIPQRWDEALAEIRPQMDSESLIPMFETMVDRALSKAQDTHA